MRAVVFLIHLRGHCIEHTESFDISALVEHLAEDGKADLGPVWIQVVPPVVLFVPKVQIVLIVPNK